MLTIVPVSPLLQDGTTALLKAANKGYNDVIEELLKFSPTLGILKVRCKKKLCHSVKKKGGEGEGIG
jgi:hypothetical protein